MSQKKKQNLAANRIISHCAEQGHCNPNRLLAQCSLFTRYITSEREGIGKNHNENYLPLNFMETYCHAYELFPL